MTGPGGRRIYLDWNATAPLRPEARAAMLVAMDQVGNPSSVHAEGRAARAIVETARGQVAALVGCDPEAVVFTSGATEAVSLVAAQGRPIRAAAVEHDCVVDCASGTLPVAPDGAVRPDRDDATSLQALQAANGETGRLQDLAALRGIAGALVDAAQAAGKVALPRFGRELAAGFLALSAHKLGGPKGVGALVVGDGIALAPVQKGGGQERGRRSGTENVIGIAGFGAAAAAARRDLEAHAWAGVENLRNILEDRLEAAAPDLMFPVRKAPRLPNTACFALPGWPGETQVMAMDLAGFAVSAGSACSSGKVKRASRALMAMGCDEVTASSAIRVSLGPTTTEAEVMAFAGAWEAASRRRRERAA